MFKLIKGAECYTPGYIGKKDILLVCREIWKIEKNIPENILPELEIINCEGRIACPALIDQHVHIIGGGGEEGPSSRIPELMLSEIISAGVGTLVGVLGVDDITRNMGNLLAKARSLEIEGITTYIYTGSYSVPTATLTGKPVYDMVLIDKVIGIGEIALSDYRSSHPTLQQLIELASDAKIGSLLSGKAGILHLHVGDGKQGISMLQNLLNESEFPIEMFVPTHLNRNKTVFNQAIEYAKRGGYVDLTAGETAEAGYTIPDALELMLKSGVDISRVSVSSDANGSIPPSGSNTNLVGSIKQLFDDIRLSILNKKVGMEQGFKVVTENTAKILKLYPRKGALKPGSDADILILNKNSLNIEFMFIRGEKFIENGSQLKKGKYEK